MCHVTLTGVMEDFAFTFFMPAYGVVGIPCLTGLGLRLVVICSIIVIYQRINSWVYWRCRYI